MSAHVAEVSRANGVAATLWRCGGRFHGAGSDPADSVRSSTASSVQAHDESEATVTATTATATAQPAQATPSGGLSWELVKSHQWDALWFFCGEHPSGFSTSVRLRAVGYSDPARVSWFVRQGADTVYAPGGFTGPEITLHSSAGSRRAGDVHIEVQETMPDGTVTSHLGDLTVRKPHRLHQEWSTEHNTCPPWDAAGAGCPSLWSEINYRIFDNVGGTIVGATVNELFPGPVVADQPNHWSAATITSGTSWPNTNGTFTDNLYKCCGIPPPVPPSSPQWGDAVYHEPQEFYVGSEAPGKGCRVQVHTLQFLSLIHI